MGVRVEDDQPDARIAALEQRVKVLEDQLQLYRLVSSYGPAVDTGSSEAAGALWDGDGYYEFESGAKQRLNGPAGVAAMVQSDGHQRLIRQGCAHVLALPVDRGNGRFRACSANAG
jgi:hypothetical protein